MTRQHDLCPPVTVEHPTTGQSVEIRFYDHGNVLWMSDWSAVSPLVKAGVLRRGPVLTGCYGHRDLFLVERDGAA